MLRHRARDLTATTTICVALATLLLGGCGNDDNGDGADNTAQVCSDVEALRTSAADLTQVTIDADTLARLQDDLTAVRDDVSTLVTDAQDAFGPEVSAVDEAVSGLTTSLEAALATPSVATLTDVRTARQTLGASITALDDAVRGSC